MQEVREICDGMLAEPPPPMASPDDLLRFARRSRARHRARLAVGFAAAATFVATAAVPLLAKPSGQVANVVAAPSSAAAPSAMPALVSSMLPEGDTFATMAQTGQVWFLRTFADEPMPIGDLCQAEYPLHFKVKVTPGSCEVITVGSVQIRTGTFHVGKDGHAPAYEVTFAIRYMDNGVFFAMHVPKEGEPGLSRRELAEKLVALPEKLGRR